MSVGKRLLKMLLRGNEHTECEGEQIGRGLLQLRAIVPTEEEEDEDDETYRDEDPYRPHGKGVASVSRGAALGKVGRAQSEVDKLATGCPPHRRARCICIGRHRRWEA